MQTSNKKTPKSCSCHHCRRGKRTTAGHFIKKMGEHAMRSQWRNQRNQEDPFIAAAPNTGPTD